MSCAVDDGTAFAPPTVPPIVIAAEGNVPDKYCGSASSAFLE
jgi:hypothetical protein